MKQELEDKLYKQYPWLRPIDGFGMDIGDGWYNIIDTLAGYIDMAIKFENDCVEKYKRDQLLGKTGNWTWKPRDHLYEFPTVHQIKNKMGGLRFYATTPAGTRYEFNGATHFAESISFTICEECGNKGHERDNAFIQTLCDDCYIKISKNSKRFAKLREMEAKHSITREEAKKK